MTLDAPADLKINTELCTLRKAYGFIATRKRITWLCCGQLLSAENSGQTRQKTINNFKIISLHKNHLKPALVITTYTTSFAAEPLYSQQKLNSLRETVLC